MGLLTSPRDKKVVTDYQRTLGRERAKRHYYNKLKLLDDLQRQVEGLQAQYDLLLTAKREQEGSTFCDEVNQNQTSSLHRTYVELTQVKKTLTQENSALERLKAKYLAVERKIKQLCITEDHKISTSIQEHTNRRRNPQLKVNLLTSDQFYELMAESFLEIKAFRESKNYSSTGMEVFGWRDRHVFSKDKLGFSLNKVFPGQELEKIVESHWQALLQPESIEKLHPDNAEVHFHVVQRLDEEAVVYYYTLERGDGAIRVQAFMVVMRLNLGLDGVVIIFRTLNPNTYLQQGKEHVELEPHREYVWLDSFLWSYYEYVGDQKNDCRYTTGGEIQGNALTSASWWYLELLQATMAFETEMIGSRGLLCL
ncbi:hypothetical protein PHMEG_00018821 [Phytophthora megakarya]|uniref:Uncharacterized protein n=1 Tax=Phytophthora megakarya TaxID=4795 RepID=A0A225VT33_9STRA|nr:hypothetical protein PHMEG_00018821 [Phytophthora megakarya]